jgi:hypothetical protein
MSEYRISELLYATNFVSTAGSCGGMSFTFDFKIDLNGNVYVKEGINHYNELQPLPTNIKYNIIDNIQMPEYIIDLFKYIMKTHCRSIPRDNTILPNSLPWSLYMGNNATRVEIVEMFFDIVKTIKHSLKENITTKSKNTIDIDSQLKLFVNKNKILEEELENMNKKIKNIQTAYFDAINDNEKMKQQNKLLLEKINKLEEQVKTGNIVYVETPKYIETTTRNYSSYRGTINAENTGTLPNAANRMVYNEYKGIYEPEEN